MGVHREKILHTCFFLHHINVYIIPHLCERRIDRSITLEITLEATLECTMECKNLCKIHWSVGFSEKIHGFTCRSNTGKIAPAHLVIRSVEILS